MEREQPLISVIVPIYKVERYLPQCLDSILVQTFEKFELLLIDDGSPDCSGKICDEYAEKDERIRVFHQKNAGVSVARNKGLEEAKGRYIVFVDSDDYVLPHYLRDLYDATSKGEDKGLVIETVIKLYFDGSKELVQLPNMDLTLKNVYCLLTELADKYASYPYAKLYDKALIDKYHIRFTSDITLLEDLFFLLDYALHADFIYIRPIANYVYRVGYSSEALSARRRSFSEEYDVFRNYYSRIILYKETYKLNSDSLMKAWRSLAVFFHRTLLSLYLGIEPILYKDRICLMKEINLNYHYWIKYLFVPDYKADRIAKMFLTYRMYACFDLWMRVLLNMNFKYMFGKYNRRLH